jgi:hypothetical protein
MLAIAITFKSRDPQVRDIWTVVSDMNRTSTDDKSDQLFCLTNNPDEAHVFHDYNDMLEVQGNIARVLNRIEYFKGEGFDEKKENTRNCVETIREHFAKGYVPEFSLYELSPKKLGTFNINIRSDALI